MQELMVSEVVLNGVISEGWTSSSRHRDKGEGDLLEILPCHRAEGGLMASWGAEEGILRSGGAGGISRPGNSRSVGMLSFPQGVLSYGHKQSLGEGRQNCQKHC